MSSDEIDRLRQEAADRQKEVSRGEQAKRIYEDALFKEAVEAVRDRIWDQFSRCPVADDRGLLVARIKLECMDEVLRELRHHMDTGKMASQHLPLIRRTLDALRRKRKRI